LYRHLRLHRKGVAQTVLDAYTADPDKARWGWPKLFETIGSPPPDFEAQSPPYHHVYFSPGPRAASQAEVVSSPIP